MSDTQEWSTRSKPITPFSVVEQVCEAERAAKCPAEQVSEAELVTTSPTEQICEAGQVIRPSPKQVCDISIHNKARHQEATR